MTEPKIEDIFGDAIACFPKRDHLDCTITQLDAWGEMEHDYDFIKTKSITFQGTFRGEWIGKELIVYPHREYLNVEDLNLNRLQKRYADFLKNHENIGCPMLSAALANLQNNQAVCGEVNGEPHCWVVGEKKIYDLNNNNGNIALIVTGKGNKAYVRMDIKPITQAKKLGLTANDFEHWTKNFRDAMEK